MSSSALAVVQREKFGINGRDNEVEGDIDENEENRDKFEIGVEEVDETKGK